MSYDEITAIFRMSLALDSADYRFKISSADWSTVDFGGDVVDDPSVDGFDSAQATRLITANSDHKTWPRGGS